MKLKYYLIKDATCLEKVTLLLYKNRPDFVDELSETMSYEYLLHKVRENYLNKSLIWIRFDDTGEASPISVIDSDLDWYSLIDKLEDPREQVTIWNRKLRTKI